MLQKIVGWIIVVLIVVWIITNPSSAGDTVHGWITGIIDFFRHLA